MLCWKCSQLQIGGFWDEVPRADSGGHVHRSHPSCWVTPHPPSTLTLPTSPPTTTANLVTPTYAHPLLQYRRRRGTTWAYGLTDYICFRCCRLQSNYPRAAQTLIPEAAQTKLCA